ncbi:MAG: hypothetical protein P1P64_01160 [Treponemataceae bacterium]
MKKKFHLEKMSIFFQGGRVLQLDKTGLQNIAVALFISPASVAESYSEERSSGLLKREFLCTKISARLCHFSVVTHR